MSNKHIDRIFKKSKAKLIALPVVAVICVALIVVVNVVLNMFATILHRVFAGDGVDVSGSAGKTASHRYAESNSLQLFQKIQPLHGFSKGHPASCF